MKVNFTKHYLFKKKLNHFDHHIALFDLNFGTLK